MLKKVTVEKIENPYDGYKYNAKIWFSNNGKDWWYCGFGRYCRTLSELISFKKAQFI